MLWGAEKLVPVEYWCPYGNWFSCKGLKLDLRNYINSSCRNWNSHQISTNFWKHIVSNNMKPLLIHWRTYEIPVQHELQIYNQQILVQIKFCYRIVPERVVHSKSSFVTHSNNLIFKIQLTLGTPFIEMEVKPWIRLKPMYSFGKKWKIWVMFIEFYEF